MPLLERRVTDNIVDAARVHGIPGVRLDGNDVGAVYAATVEAVGRGRRGHGPTLLECRTYRWRGHVGPSWDTDVGVKRRDELKDWLPKDPIARARDRLLVSGVPADAMERLDGDVRREVEEALIYARESPYPPEGDLLTHVYWSSGEES
jgi:TPP-dependent pyruvate/acetoin dehydrogenase alpha subunit